MKTSNFSITALLILGIVFVSSVNAQYQSGPELKSFSLKGGVVLLEEDVLSLNYGHFDQNSKIPVLDVLEYKMVSQGFQSTDVIQIVKDRNGSDSESANVSREFLLAEASLESIGFVEENLEMEPWMMETSWMKVENLTEVDQDLTMEKWMTVPTNWIAGTCR